MPDKPFYDKMGPLLLETAKEHYYEDENPIHLMNAFTWALEYKMDIPLWVTDKLYEVFKEYVKDENSETLDALMGCTKGKGQSPAKTELERYGMYLKLMTDIDILTRHEIKVEDAIRISIEHNRDLSPPFFRTVKNAYYNDGWRSKLEKITEYPQFDLPEILKSTPKDIKKKYPHFFKK